MEAVNTGKALEVLEKGSCLMGEFREADLGYDITYEWEQEEAAARDQLNHPTNIYQVPTVARDTALNKTHSQQPSCF